MPKTDKKIKLKCQIVLVFEFSLPICRCLRTKKGFLRRITRRDCFPRWRGVIYRIFLKNLRSRVVRMCVKGHVVRVN